ncbi:MAG TPA: TcpQ domain-containing protein, partial [Burkholderiaceae bacterium]|nr:TcpQ domain-containing protein [Burkholderiaceae bacterium]
MDASANYGQKAIVRSVLIFIAALALSACESVIGWQDVKDAGSGMKEQLDKESRASTFAQLEKDSNNADDEVNMLRKQVQHSIDVDDIHWLKFKNMAASKRPSGSWKIKSGEKISDAFLRWSKVNNDWKLAWEAPELVAQLDIGVNGSFEDAVRTTIKALNRNDAQLEAKFYVDESNRILRVS